MPDRRRSWKKAKKWEPHYDGCYGHVEVNGEVRWCPRCGAVAVGKGDWRHPGAARAHIEKARKITQALVDLREGVR